MKEMKLGKRSVSVFTGHLCALLRLIKKIYVTMYTFLEEGVGGHGSLVAPLATLPAHTSTCSCVRKARRCTDLKILIVFKWDFPKVVVAKMRVGYTPT